MQKYEDMARDLFRALNSSQIVDYDVLIRMTSHTKNIERQFIRDFYLKIHGNDLISDLKTHLNGDFERLVVGMFRSPTEYDTVEIYEAIDGIGTNEDTLTEIVGSRTNIRLNEIHKWYRILYNGDLNTMIKEEKLNKEYTYLILKILEGRREENGPLNKNLVRKDAEDLFNAGEAIWGTDEKVFFNIFCSRSPIHLHELIDYYRKMTNKSLLKIVESEFSGSVKDLLLTILKAQVDPADYYAERIYKACKGLGTSDRKLIRAFITMDEFFMEEIKNIYIKKYQVSIYDQVKDETEGPYQKLLLKILCGSNSYK